MTTNTPARPSLMNAAINLIIIGFVALMVYLLWPYAAAQWSGAQQQQPALIQPTASARLQAPPVARPQEAAPIAAPAIPGIAQNEATAQAMYDAAVQAAEPVLIPNVNNTGDTAPVQLMTKPNVREASGANVPTAEPLIQTNDQFGSKQKPINIQETHTCLHGQVWNGKGCKNP